MKKKKFLITTAGIFLAVCTFCASYNYSDISEFTSATMDLPKTVIIDAGHAALRNTID